MLPIPGIHHVTAIAGAAQRNLDFYVGCLGLRLVKRTVNFDDPGTYHFYYGDEVGRPGTILTFFPWQGMPQGRAGPGMASATAFAVPPGSLGFWTDRFAAEAMNFEPPRERFGQQVLAFADPDGLPLELVEDPGAEARRGWEAGPVPTEHALRGFHGVTLCVEGYERTARLLTEVFGWEHRGEEGERIRFIAPGAEAGRVVDLRFQPNRRPGRMGAGTGHHVAFRARDDAEQREWREALVSLGFDVTPVVDRDYFHSIYFREPGGVLFEIATDPPGFTVDESVEELGTHLRLPPWLEARRGDVESVLPPLRLPDLPDAGR